MKEIRILSPQGMLGYGYPIESLEYGLAQHPHAISVDAGSTDGGPHRLGMGVGGVSRYATKKDLTPLVIAAKKHNIPLLIGSAGGSGANLRVQWTVDILKEIAEEENIELTIAAIYADVSKDWLMTKWEQGKVTSVGSAPLLTEQAIQDTTALVGQMGVEPYLEALKEGVDIIVGGRTYDPVMTAALPLFHRMDPGLSWHMGKILECGAIAATPGTAKDGMIGMIRDDHFLVRPLHPSRKCTIQSVAAHTLYEKSHPYLLPGPGGILDLSQCKFSQEDEQTVRVTGSQFIPSSQYEIKLEGVRPSGYRTVLVAGVRDPFFIHQLETIIEKVKKDVADYFPEIESSEAKLYFKYYGLNGVMGPWETTSSEPLEVGIVIEVVAPTQELADSICAYARSVLMHIDYEGRVSTAGNLALPFAPPEFSAGQVFEFSIYHTVAVDDPLELFTIKRITLGRRKS
ncbi:acyclic terpene utilization AtuA family protein [Aeribacillus pallidus]|uniref:acyclic terpene utilization AtuA family protein n=1 Tax=Aeribacillus pallidus TaxID=33936 RepID=UPI003D2152F8